MTGELATIAKFQQAFRPYMREGSMIPTPGVSYTDAGMSALLGTVGAAAHGPQGLIAGGLPLLRTPVRNALLSRSVQESLVRRPQTANALTRSMPRLISEKKAVALGRGSLPAIYFAEQNQ